ncbi:hypothetical protein B0H63DRAFT_197759 [Podospora didyma]|uniref:MIT domain-containing protein n=1 Tax=Podospora didyma TaxID=330526 RepID=A0AAE0NGW7_9PEZI|nr:hypothetical protein B0H63DRAFT_197759 [Podospora didyma]
MPSSHPAVKPFSTSPSSPSSSRQHPLQLPDRTPPPLLSSRHAGISSKHVTSPSSPSRRQRVASRDEASSGAGTPPGNNSYRYPHDPVTAAVPVDSSALSPAPAPAPPPKGPRDLPPTIAAPAPAAVAPKRHQKASSAATATSTVASTHRVSYTAFPSHTSPPAKITFDLPVSDAPSDLADPFNDPTLPASDPAKDLEPPRWGHSRSRSTGGLSDSFRNLNRWSTSTTSSHASNLANFTRRVSADVLAGAFGSPSKRLHKSRPSTGSDTPQTNGHTPVRDDSPGPTPIPPLLSLPLISTGPSLEDEFNQSNVLGRESPTRQRPIHIRRPIDDPGLYWDGTPQTLEEKPGLSSQQLEPAAAIKTAAAAMPYTQNGEPRGHSRSRSTGAKGSADTTSSSKSRDRERDRDRDRAGKPPSQKAMLSKALQKANTAVQLDNAQNIEGARRAYSEACAFLQQVLARTSAEDDRKKLEAIHQTYTSRITELDELLAGQESDGKELPQRPESNEPLDDVDEFMSSPFTSYPDEDSRGLAKPSGFSRDRLDYDRDSAAVPSYSVPTSATRRSFSTKPHPNLSIEISAQVQRDPRDGTSTYLTEQYSLQSAFSRTRFDNGVALQPPMDNEYLPPPLSPRRPLSPSKPPPPPPGQSSPDRISRNDFSVSGNGIRLGPSSAIRGHQRGNSHESVSWLDPIDESGGSASSSVHSRSSSLRIRRKHIRAASGDTEAEFDAALDDAIEAAYDEGYEPEAQIGEDLYREEPEAAVAKTLRRVELARERVRESEREALELANEREKNLRLQQQLEDEEYRRKEFTAEDFYRGMSSDDEERVLEEMTSGYIIEDFAFGQPTKTSVPRESDSSGFTSRTWHSSMGSNPPTTTTILTTVSENTIVPQMAGPMPPPTQALPQLPPQPSSAGSQSSSQSVRNRRMSGTNPKQLKIETAKITQTVPPATAGPAFPSQTKTSSYIVQQRQALSAGPNRTVGPLSARAGPSPVPGALGEGSGTPPMPTGFLHDDQPRSGSPSVSRPALRKNFSSSSLKSLKSRNLSVSNEDVPDLSPGTPLSNQYGLGGSATRLPALPSIPTPLAGTFKERANSSGTGGLHLFDSQFPLPGSPGSPSALMADAPAPLEPCPNDVMLRPFWLMRCLYQTLCHPRGGYLSNKLFVPRDVWRVKGVKLKNLEDKIANCDYLTAALQKLARVDTCDADAVLEEMQSLEGMLEQVQATLTRKLGNEVGVHGTSTMFKDASAAESEAASVPRSTSVSAKGSSSFSWRRLRSKNSSANLPGMATSYGGKGGSGGASSSATPIDGLGSKDMLLPSLPMTTHPTSRPTKRNVGMVVFAGPNANYMSALARLFDAAQTIGEASSCLRDRTKMARVVLTNFIDQIARQVDDPGLRHADKTQVGLELCTRHAAEFFGFYICRFVLSDLTLMLDKFVKRGSEWVMV